MTEPSTHNTRRKRSTPLTQRFLRAALIFAVVPYLVITLLFTLLQRRLIYVPTRSDRLTVDLAGLDPANSRDVSLTTDDGLTLHGWLLAGRTGSESTNNVQPQTNVESPPLVIYFPGNAANRAGRVNDLRDFTRLGCDVLIFDYRGYAENPGSPSEAALAADARAVWTFAMNELPADPGRTLLFGESLGGAVAVNLASSLCCEGTPPAALITNATFDSLPSLSGHHYPLFPFRWLLWDRWPSVDRIAHVTCPLLMFHGTADEIVPIAHGRQLFAAAPACSLDGCAKTFVEITGAGHNDIPVASLREQILHLLVQSALQ